MNVQALANSVEALEAEWIALGIYENETEPPQSVLGTSLGNLLSTLFQTKDLTGDLGSTSALYGVAGVAARSVLVFGLGRREQYSSGSAFSAGVAVSKRLATKGRGAVAVVLPEPGEDDALAASLVEGLVVGTRGVDIRKREASRHPFTTLHIVKPSLSTDLTSLSAAIDRGVVVGEAINLARDLANTPPAEKKPSVLASRARLLAMENGIGVELWDENRIKVERFGGLLGVASGSAEPPSFVVLEYQNGDQSPTLALVGKGVTFDSGGLSLKPSASMEDMKSDMTGAAVVLATMIAIARLKLRVNVRGYLALTENMTGGGAMKLGDVLTMRDGTTVEVMNTDAEGRLILADALSYAVERKPGVVIDLATLTGACLVALGPKIAGLFANDDALSDALLAACKRNGERAWRLPLDPDFKEALKSPVADLKNLGGKWGGAITAAKFLEHFVGETPWAHLDIAGPSWNDSATSLYDEGGTGCFVRTLVSFIASRAV